MSDKLARSLCAAYIAWRSEIPLDAAAALIKDIPLDAWWYAMAEVVIHRMDSEAGRVFPLPAKKESVH